MFMTELRNLISPWQAQDLTPFLRTYGELQGLIERSSKSQIKLFLYVTLLEFFIATAVIAMGSQATKFTESDLDIVNFLVTSFMSILLIYVLNDFFNKFQRIKSVFPSYLFLKRCHRARESFKKFLVVFLFSYGIYFLLILSSIFLNIKDFKVLLFLPLSDNNLVVDQVYFFWIISFPCTVGILFSIWRLEMYLHKRIFSKINKNMTYLKKG